MGVNLSTKVHEKGSRGSAQSIGLFCDCVPCEPCEPYKLKLLENAHARSGSVAGVGSTTPVP